MSEPGIMIIEVRILFRISNVGGGSQSGTPQEDLSTASNSGASIVLIFGFLIKVYNKRRKNQPFNSDVNSKNNNILRQYLKKMNFNIPLSLLREAGRTLILIELKNFVLLVLGAGKEF
jgi:hypothetical protein